jgi:hypothetical protein
MNKSGDSTGVEFRRFVSKISNFFQIKSSWLAFWLLLFVTGGLFFGNPRVLKFKPIDHIIEIPKPLTDSKVFLELAGELPSGPPLEIVLSDAKRPTESIRIVNQEVKPNWKNLFIQRMEHIEPGRFEVQVFSGSQNLSLKEIRLEYRQSAPEFLSLAWKAKDTRFQITSVLLCLMILIIFSMLWIDSLSVALVGFIFSIASIWILIPPMSGLDDIFHLPRAIQGLTEKVFFRAYSETTDLIKSSNYMELNGLPEELIEKYRNTVTICPMQLAQPELSFRNCTQDDSSLYSRFLWIHRSLRPFHSATDVEVFTKVLNQLFVFIFVIALAAYFWVHFQFRFFRSLGAGLLALLVPYYFVPHTMGTGVDFYIFCLASLSLIMSSYAIEKPAKISIPILFLTLGLNWLLIQEVNAENHKRLFVFYPSLVAGLLLIAKFIESKKVFQKANRLQICVASFVVVTFCLISFATLIQSAIYRDPGVTLNWKIVFVNILEFSYIDGLKKWIRALSGPLITNKAALIPQLMLAQVGLLIWIAVRSLKYVKSRVNQWTFLYLTALTLSIPILLILPAILFNDPLWIFPRYTYPCWGAFFFCVTYWAAAEPKHFRTLASIAILVQFLATTTMIIPNFWMKLGFYP